MITKTCVKPRLLLTSQPEPFAQVALEFQVIEAEVSCACPAAFEGVGVPPYHRVEQVATAYFLAAHPQQSQDSALHEKETPTCSGPISLPGPRFQDTENALDELTFDS